MSTQPVLIHVLEALIGGTSRHVVDVVTSTEGFTHVVVVPSERFDDVTDTTAVPLLTSRGIQVRTIDMRRSPKHPDNARALLRIRRLITELGPAIVHGHSHIGGALARVAALPSRSVPRVWTPNGVHTTGVILGAERALSRITSATIAVSESEAELLRNERLTRPGRLVTIPNGIDTTRQGTGAGELRRLAGVPPEVPLVGMIGRLFPQKAPADFVTCCELIHRERPDAHFLLIGDGPLAPEVDAKAAALTAAGKFHRLNYVPNAGQHLDSLDVFVLLSAFEGGPYAPLEAMREGVPVVLTDVVGNRDSVRDGVTGHLVEPGDSAAAARAVVDLLGNPARREEMVQAAHGRLEEKFSARAMGAAHRDLYERLLRRAPIG